ncbi:MAG: hypothetical protein JNM19_10585 [Chitinophagaceae bacterium]|nr:hypothetical protein [Chitinophagaceae bacterium]
MKRQSPDKASLPLRPSIRIFTGMIGKRQIRITLLVFILAFICQCVQPLLAAPSAAATTFAERTIVSYQDKLPNAELERVQVPVVSGAHILVQKSFSPVILQAAASFVYGADLLNNAQLRESARLRKDYLFYIYPSHHFW